jgi:hypothetical protein
MYIDLGLLYSNVGGLADCPEEVFSQLADHLLEGLNRWAMVSYTAMQYQQVGTTYGFQDLSLETYDSD